MLIRWNEKYLNYTEACELLGVGRERLRQLREQNVVRTFLTTGKDGGRFFNEQDLLDYEESRRKPGRPRKSAPEQVKSTEQRLRELERRVAVLEGLLSQVRA